MWYGAAPPMPFHSTCVNIFYKEAWNLQTNPLGEGYSIVIVYVLQLQYQVLVSVGVHPNYISIRMNQIFNTYFDDNLYLV